MAETNIEIKLRRVRLSFAELFEPVEGQTDDKKPNGKFAYSASLLLDKVKDAEQVKAIRAAMSEAKKAKWGDKSPVISPDRLCLKDGEPINPETMQVDEATGNPIPGTGQRVARYAGYEGQFELSAKAHVKSKDAPNPIQLLGPRKTAKDASGNPCFPTVKESDGLLYSGAVVDAIVRIYAFDGTANGYGNRILCSLEAVKFVEHGEAFGTKKVDAQSAFDEEPDDGGFDDKAAGGAGAADTDDMGI